MRKKTALIIFTLLVSISLLAFALFWLRPAKVVQDAFTKLATSDTQSFNAIISISNPQASLDILGEQASIQLDVNGKFKRENDKQDSLEAAVKLTTKTETVTMIMEANIIFIGEQAYFQIIKAPPAFPALAQLKGQWIEIPRGMQEEVKKTPVSGKIFLDIKSNERLEINGVSTKIYKTTATSAAVVRMLDSIASILGTNLSEKQKNEIQKGVADTETIPVNLAIAPWSREIRQIKSYTVIPSTKSAITIEFTFTDRNQPVIINAPDNAQTLSNIAGLKTDSIGQ